MLPANQNLPPLIILSISHFESAFPIANVKRYFAVFGACRNTLCFFFSVFFYSSISGEAVTIKHCFLHCLFRIIASCF
ncbi:hypothetical protein L873DRAFT_629573 [Choiromyces venosus 120613-1]|uniref:Uncharacterized protein n=1 Tax=Choiromyces venosus 120613-1 TaxID=1336337 RepID=A0A3N4JWX3_9PEZI|nr:hypothetical protein L873DRAFT_629573 [Choiromyces venosus 120613-1]